MSRKRWGYQIRWGLPRPDRCKERVEHVAARRSLEVGLELPDDSRDCEVFLQRQRGPCNLCPGTAGNVEGAHVVLAQPLWLESPPCTCYFSATINKASTNAEVEKLRLKDSSLWVHTGPPDSRAEAHLFSRFLQVRPSHEPSPGVFTWVVGSRGGAASVLRSCCCRIPAQIPLPPVSQRRRVPGCAP